MKIHHKRGFVRGVVFLTLGITVLLDIWAKGYHTRFGLVATLMFLLAAMDITRSFSKVSALEDSLADTDERDQYIIMKTARMALNILQSLNLGLTLLLMVLYSLTNSPMFLGAFILAAGYTVLSFIIILTANLYYEKHE